MTIGPMPLCMACKHTGNSKWPACAAYPDGIPMSIILNEVDHRKPQDGDNGIQFEMTDGADELYAAILEGLGWDEEE